MPTIQFNLSQPWARRTSLPRVGRPALARALGLAAALGLALLASGCGKSAGDARAEAQRAAPAKMPDVAKPAMWRVGDAETNIYLLGTVHALPPALNWRSPTLDKAFTNAKAVYFETDLNPEPAALQKLVLAIGVYTPPERLTQHLDEAQQKRISAVAAKFNINMDTLDRMKPWFAALMISQAFLGTVSYDPMAGVDRKLSIEAAEKKLQVRYFETPSEQLHFFADLSEKAQLDYLLDGARQIEEEPDLLERLVVVWARGDLPALEKLIKEDESSSSPEVNDALLKARNARWAEKLDTLSKTEAGDFFVAVGAAHLAGPDSVLAMLKARGYEVTRVQ